MEWLDAELYHLFFADNHLLQALVLFVGLDYIAGVCVAIQKKKLSSQIGAKGITRKVAIFVVIALCHILDSYLAGPTNYWKPWRLCFICPMRGSAFWKMQATWGSPSRKS